MIEFVEFSSRCCCVTAAAAAATKGVANGNYRCSYLGFDLNRHWLAPSAWAQPEILSVKNLVTELHQDPAVDLDLYIGELHTSMFQRSTGFQLSLYTWSAEAVSCFKEKLSLPWF